MVGALAAGVVPLVAGQVDLGWAVPLGAVGGVLAMLVTAWIYDHVP